jgi:hypothetical protein
MIWRFKLEQTADIRVLAGATSNVTAYPSASGGFGVRFDTNAPAAATLANDNATCALAGACRDATGTYATYLMTAPHGFTLIGQHVTIAGLTDATLNGDCVVTSFPSTSKITCANAGAANAHDGAGSATPMAETNFQYVSYTSATTATVVDSGVAAGTGFHTAKIRSVVAGTLLFSMDGGAESSIATNVSTNALQPSIYAVADTNAEKDVQIDLFDFYASGLAR